MTVKGSRLGPASRAPSSAPPRKARGAASQRPAAGEPAAEAEDADGNEDDPADAEDDEPSAAELEGSELAGGEPSTALAAKPAPGVGLARYDALSTYMREVQRHPLLTSEEEHALAVRYAEEQDVDAAARLVTANLRLVVKIAYEYRRAYRNMMDLVQEGNIGLMQAVKKYDPYRGVKLSSYAAWWIRAYMLRFILNNWRLVKIGTTQAQRKLFFNLSKEKQKLTAMGIEPSHSEIAKRLNVDEKDVIEMDRRLARSDASLDATMNESDGRPTTRMELMPSPNAGPDERTEGAELQVLVRERLDEFRTTLAGKELIIFDERLVADEPKTLQQLGDVFGVSRERVRQLEARLTSKLRDYLTESLGDAVRVWS